VVTYKIKHSSAQVAQALLTVGMSVRLSVPLSVRRCVETTRARIMKSSPTDSPWGTLDLAKKIKKFDRVFCTQSESDKCEWGRQNLQFSANELPNLRNGAREDQGYINDIRTCPFDCC